MIFQLAEVNPAVPVKQERQTKSSLTNTKSDQYCSPLSGRVAEQDDYQQLPQSKTQIHRKKKKEKTKKTQIHKLPHRDRSPAEKHADTHKHKHTVRAVTEYSCQAITKAVTVHFSIELSTIHRKFPSGSFHFTAH